MPCSRSARTSPAWGRRASSRSMRASRSTSGCRWSASCPGTTVAHVLERLYDGALLITPGDRVDVLLAALFAHGAPALPTVAGIVLTGGQRPPAGLLTDAPGTPPVVLTARDTFETASLVAGR